jgi:dihydropteroate synthase
MLGVEHLAGLLEKNCDAAKARVQEFSIGAKHFAFNTQPYIMGVINLSPDSWYRESVCLNTEQAVRRGRLLAVQGADIIDVGAESTLAHAERAADTLQNSKLLPVIEGLREYIVSVETYSPQVAEQCLAAGAKVLNLTGSDEKLYSIATEHDATVIICYVQGPNVREVGDLIFKGDIIATMYEYFARKIEIATRAGVKKILVDPGLGFYYRNLQDSAARVRHQMTVFLNTFRLRALGFPTCHALPHAFEYFGDEVRSAEPFFAVLAALGKTDLFRTHEVPKTKAVLDVLRLFDTGTPPPRPRV